MVIDLKKDCTLTDLDIIGDLLQPMDKGADFVIGDNNYVWFYLIAKYYRPKVIAETGTRFGYSMKAFVNGAGHKLEKYSLWSYDSECDGIKTLDIFRDYFIQSLGINKLCITRANTKTLTSIGANWVDLFLVDADHTTEGCYHECSLGFEALKIGGVMVVDDVNFDDVKAGAEKFCADNNLSYTYLPSLRGIYLIEKKPRLNIITMRNPKPFTE